MEAAMKRITPLWVVLTAIGLLIVRDAACQPGSCANPATIGTLPYCHTGTLSDFISVYGNCDFPDNPDTLKDVVFRYYSPYPQTIKAGVCAGTNTPVMLGIWESACPNTIPGDAEILVSCEDDFGCGESLPGPPSTTLPCVQAFLQAERAYWFVISARFINNNFIREGNFHFFVHSEYVSNFQAGCQCLSSPPSCPGTEHDFEPENDLCPPLVSELAIQIGDTVHADISNFTDRDWIRIFDSSADTNRFVRYEVEIWDGSTAGRCTFGRGLGADVKFWENCETQIGLSFLSPGIFRTGILREKVFRYISIEQVLTFGQPFGPFVLSVRMIPVPRGDFCGNAIPIPSLPFCFCGSTVDYYDDNSAGGPDIYFSYTPTQIQQVSASTCGSAFNTCLRQSQTSTSFCPGVETLIDCGGCGNNRGCLFASTFVPGSTYFFVLDGGFPPPNTGDFELVVRAGACCPCALCTPVDCGFPNHDIEPANITCQAGIGTVNCGDTLCGSLSAADRQDWYVFDDWFEFSPIGDTSGRAMKLIVEVHAGDTPGNFACTSSLNPALTLARGLECSQVIAQDLDGGQGGDCLIVLNCESPNSGPLYIGISDEGINGGGYRLIVRCEPCFTIGDICEEPFIILNLPYCYDEGDSLPNVFGHDYSPPCSSGVLLQNATDIVFRFEPDRNMTVNANTLGSDHNTAISVWENGCPAESGTHIGCATQCLNNLNLIAGSFYYFILDGVAPDEEGNGVFSISEEGNCIPCADVPVVCPYTNRDNEPDNDSCQTVNANFSTLECNQFYCGEISSPSDRDYYVVTFPPDTYHYRVAVAILADDTPNQFAFGGGLNPRAFAMGYDLDSCEIIESFDDDGGIGTDALVESPCRPSLRWKIRIESADGSVGPYILHILTCRCGAEAQRCRFECLPDARLESEICGVTLDNAGCNHPAQLAFDSIMCGDKICGVAFKDAVSTDYDWYRLLIDEPRQIRFNVHAEFDARWRLLAAHPSGLCFELDTLDCKYSPRCDHNELISCVGPGTYYLQVEPASIDTCRYYNVELTCSSCAPDTCARVTQLRGRIRGDGSGIIDYTFDPIQAADEYLIYASDNIPVDITPANYVGKVAASTFTYTAVSHRKFLVVLAYCRGDTNCP